MLKWIHNRAVAKYALAAAGLLFVGFYGWNAFPIGEYSGKQFLTDVPGGPAILGAVAALMMGALVFILCFAKEYLREDVTEYSRLRNDDRFIKAFKWFTWTVLALEACSVAFRWYLLNFSKLGYVLLAIGIVGIFATYVISLVLHAVVNRPPSVAAAHLREEAARQAFGDAEKQLPNLTIGQKRQVASGDPRPIDDVRDAKWQEREDEVAAIRKRQQQATDAEVERQRVADEQTRKNEEFYHKMVSPPLDPPGRNGKQPANFH